jgi:hypothetical protein
MDQLPEIPRIRRKRKLDYLAQQDDQKPFTPSRKQKVIYSDKYPQMLEAYKKGWTTVEVCSKILHCTREWLYKAAKQDPELAHVLEMGRNATETWWVEQGRKNLKNRGFNSHMYGWLTMNIIDWQNKNKISASVDANIDSPVLDKISDGIIDKLLENS